MNTFYLPEIQSYLESYSLEDEWSWLTKFSLIWELHLGKTDYKYGQKH